MNGTEALDAHLDDGALVRIVDGEAAGPELAGATAHLESCELCAGRMHALRRRSRVLSARLAGADWPVPPLRVGPDAAPTDELAARRARGAVPASGAFPWRRAAAVLLLAGSTALVSSPVMAWLTTLVGGGGEAPVVIPSTPAPPPPPPASQVGPRVRFAVEGTDLSVRIASHQAVGVLVLRTGRDSEVSAEVEGPRGNPGADLLLLPAGLRIANTPASRAEYRIEVPATVRRVHVRVGSGAPREITADQISRGVTVRLAR